MSTGRAKAQAWMCERLHITFPFVSMGNVDSWHLFADPEPQIFALYQHHIGRWRRTLDIGANLGLHSILMAKCGFEVKAYEPDFAHFDRLLANLETNDVAQWVTPCMAAVANANGEARFVRVMNNLTGNHLEGFKDSYGPRESVIVPTVDCKALWAWADFAKIDCEGNEAAILCDTSARDWQHLSAVVEVRNEANAAAIYRHMVALEVPMWSAKRDWERVKVFGDVPRANREGPLYIGREGPWA